MQFPWQLATWRTWGIVLLITGMIQAAPPSVREQFWDFEEDQPGAIAEGFTGETGRWEVQQDGDNLVLAQLAENRDSVLNITINSRTSYKNLELTVRMRPVAGENEGGGGLIWRARDSRNFYALIYNPFVSRHKRSRPFLRLYKVEQGKRTQLDHSSIKGEVLLTNPAPARRQTVWHTLKITMHGERIYGYLDGERILQADDESFQDVGHIGLITKSDAQSDFDNLTVSTLDQPESE